MLRFSANISILFTDLPFLDRLGAAKAAGFDAVECWFPYEYPLKELRDRLTDLDLTMVGINSAAGGDREWGIAAVPGRDDAFRASIDQALDYSIAMGRPCVHVMAGLVGHVTREAAEDTYLRNLDYAIRNSRGTGVQLLIEPLNRRDRPDYFLSSVDQAAGLIERPELGSLKIMFDCYHVAIQDGEALLEKLQMHWAKLGHIQFASTPDRGPPGTGDMDYDAIFTEIDRLGWRGWLGAEYKQLGSTSNSFEWLTRF